MPKDYYVVLGISKGADLKKIKKAYRETAKKYHPDVTGRNDSSERFQEIKEAYDTLSDESKKKVYDRSIQENEREYRIRRAPEKIRKRASFFNETESLFSSGMDDFFNGFLPGFYDSNSRKSREKEMFFEAVLSPEEALNGGLFPVTIPVFESCPECCRSGIWDSFFCPLCDGYGRVLSERRFTLGIPPNVRDGTEIRLSLEDIGLKGFFLNILLSVTG